MKRFVISSDHEPSTDMRFCTKLQFEAEFYTTKTGDTDMEFDGQILNLCTGIVKHVSELCVEDQEAIQATLDEYAQERETLGLAYTGD